MLNIIGLINVICGIISNSVYDSVLNPINRIGAQFILFIELKNVFKNLHVNINTKIRFDRKKYKILPLTSPFST